MVVARQSPPSCHYVVTWIIVDLRNRPTQAYHVIPSFTQAHMLSGLTITYQALKGLSSRQAPQPASIRLPCPMACAIFIPTWEVVQGGRLVLVKVGGVQGYDQIGNSLMEWHEAVLILFNHADHVIFLSFFLSRKLPSSPVEPHNVPINT